MNIIQISSAVYVLVLAAVAAFVLLRTAITDKPVATGTLRGYPAYLLFIAVVVCAVTTLVAVR